MDKRAELEKKRRKERELWWKKILAYYMMEKMVEEQKKAEVITRYAYYQTQLVIQESMLGALFYKEPGSMSAMEMLEEISKDEDLDSPFKKLMDKVSEQPMSEKETEEAIAEVIEKAPPKMIEDAKAERERREALQKQEEIKAADHPLARPVVRVPDEAALRYDRMMRLKLAFLKRLMPAVLFNELCQGLAREGHAVNAAVLDIPDRNPAHMTYDQYVEAKKTQMQMHDGRFVNANNVYTSAAYMLAAYEQKDHPPFNAARADERAREIFGSKAFRVYLDSHPGSLVAAAQNTFLDITYDGMVALEQQITARDAVLDAMSKSLRSRASGQTANYHRMLNKMERFVKSPAEPSDEEKKQLIRAIGDYVLTDCAPGSEVADDEGLRDAMCAAGALLPEDSFVKLLEQVNAGRNRPLTPADLGRPNPAPQAQEANREGPVLNLGG